MLHRMKRWLRGGQPTTEQDEVDQFKRDQREIERKLASLGVNRNVLLGRMGNTQPMTEQIENDNAKPKSS